MKNESGHQWHIIISSLDRPATLENCWSQMHAGSTCQESDSLRVQLPYWIWNLAQSSSWYVVQAAAKWVPVTRTSFLYMQGHTLWKDSLIGLEMVPSNKCQYLNFWKLNWNYRRRNEIYFEKEKESEKAWQTGNFVKVSKLSSFKQVVHFLFFNGFAKEHMG